MDQDIAATTWHTEEVNDSLRMSFSLTEGGCNVEWFTEKARMELVDTVAYGKMLLIDGELQSTERDEYIYHEMLVHPIAESVCPRGPRRVKIYGGGEGAVARELLKWPSIERLVQVDWDAQLLGHFKGVWTQWSQGAFSDPRVELRVTDAWVDCAKDPDTYDIILVDLPDPQDIAAFRTLLEGVKRQLAHDCEGGGFVMNAGPVQPWNGGFAEAFVAVLEELFPLEEWAPLAYHVNIPSFSPAGEWCFLGAIRETNSVSYELPELPANLRRYTSAAMNAAGYWPADWPAAFRRISRM
jgi:spermidine synthase